jgi:DNA-binding GntR family transcriptional regulator
VREEILSGRLPSGNRIRQEELAQRFAMSRIPVRDALKQLESDGLVTLRSNSGAWVSYINPQEFEEIYKIRERLEPLALQESIANLSEAQIERLEQLSDDMQRATGTEAFLRMDREFHLTTSTRLTTKIQDRCIPFRLYCRTRRIIFRAILTFGYIRCDG